MALYIVEADCISCGDCEPVCPTNSITEGSIVFKIDKKTCTNAKGILTYPSVSRYVQLIIAYCRLRHNPMSSQDMLSRELALRIGLAARALPDTDAKRLFKVLTDCVRLPITEDKLAAST